MTLPASMASRIRAGGVSGSAVINPDTMTLVSTTQPLGVISSRCRSQRWRVTEAVGAIRALPSFTKSPCLLDCQRHCVIVAKPRARSRLGDDFPGSVIGADTSQLQALLDDRGHGTILPSRCLLQRAVCPVGQADGQTRHDWRSDAWVAIQYLQHHSTNSPHRQNAPTTRVAPGRLREDRRRSFHESERRLR